jgi:hypothetical protein
MEKGFAPQNGGQYPLRAGAWPEQITGGVENMGRVF